MFNLAYLVLELIFCMFQGWCLQHFLSGFLKSKYNVSITNVSVIVMYTIYKFGVDALVSSPEPVGSVLAVKWGIKLFILLAFIRVAYQYRKRLFLFLGISFMMVDEVSIFLAYTVSQTGRFLFELVQYIVDENGLESTSTISLMMNVASFFELLFMYLMASLILYFSLKAIMDSYHDKEYDMSKTELKFILIPGIVGMLICLMLRIIFMSEGINQGEQIYQRYPGLMIVVPCILVLSLFSLVCCIRILQEMIEMNVEKSNRVILENQVDAQQKHIDEMERIYSGIRGMKHDMANMLALVSLHLSKNGIELDTEIQEYLSDMNQTFEDYDVRFQTGNSIVDTLLSMKYYEAQRKAENLTLNVDSLIFPENMKIRGYDLSIILANAIDNAMDACERLKESGGEDIVITLSTVIKGNMVLIKVENSFDGVIPRKGKSGDPLTMKDDDSIHGYGFQNMRRTAEKYYGGVTWSVKGNMFILTVLLQNMLPAENIHR